MDPFTVDASAYPVVDTSTAPFTADRTTSEAKPRASTSPFTVRPVKRTPSGSRIRNST